MWAAWHGGLRASPWGRAPQSWAAPPRCSAAQASTHRQAPATWHLRCDRCWLLDVQQGRVGLQIGNRALVLLACLSTSGGAWSVHKTGLVNAHCATVRSHEGDVVLLLVLQPDGGSGRASPEAAARHAAATGATTPSGSECSQPLTTWNERLAASAPAYGGDGRNVQQPDTDYGAGKNRSLRRTMHFSCACARLTLAGSLHCMHRGATSNPSQGLNSCAIQLWSISSLSDSRQQGPPGVWHASRELSTWSRHWGILNKDIYLIRFMNRRRGPPGLRHGAPHQQHARRQSARGGQVRAQARASRKGGRT